MDKNMENIFKNISVISDELKVRWLKNKVEQIEKMNPHELRGELALILSIIAGIINIREKQNNILNNKFDNQELSSELDTMKKGLNNDNEITKNLNKDVSDIFIKIKDEMKKFSDEFKKALPGQIENATPQQIRRYLVPFIQDNYKSFWEKQEEFIKIELSKTTQNILSFKAILSVNDITANLPSEVSLKKNIDINSTPIDIAVAAFWIVGVSMVFFSNVLTGGLITFLAPILAVVGRDKINKALKEKAVSKGPELIDQIQNKFLSEIDKMESEVFSSTQKFFFNVARYWTEVLKEIEEKPLDSEIKIDEARNRMHDLQNSIINL